MQVQSLKPGFKWTLLISLYLSQGLPFGFFTKALPVLMREEGANLAKIGLSSLLFLPWALKWIWAPWVDAYGTRKAWIVPLQLTSICIALFLAEMDGSLLWLKIAIVSLSIISATQDVPTDALAVNLLGSKERGFGNAIQVGGFRLGMVVGGGVLMVVLDQLGWFSAFVMMALVLSTALIPLLLFKERTMLGVRVAAPQAINPLKGIAQRLKIKGMLPLLVCIAAYKLGASMTEAMSKPLLVDAGWSKTEIGVWVGAIGSTCGLAGAFLGGLASDKLGRKKALLLCGIAQVIGIGFYLWAAYNGKDAFWLKLGIGLEHLCAGMATVALFALMMDASDPVHGGTDYTLQACIVVLTIGLSGYIGGVFADTWGYLYLFMVSIIAAIAGCALMLFGLKREWFPARVYHSHLQAKAV